MPPRPSITHDSDLSPARLRWRKFLAHRRGAIALYVLVALYLFSLAAAPFLKKMDTVASDTDLAHRRRVALAFHPFNPVVRLDVDSQGTIVWSEGDLDHFGVIDTTFSLESFKQNHPDADVRTFPNLQNTRIVLREPEEQPVAKLSVTLDALPRALERLQRSTYTPRNMTLDIPRILEAAQLSFTEYVPPFEPTTTTTDATSVDLRRPQSTSTEVTEVVDVERGRLSLTLAPELITWPFRPVWEHPLGTDMAGRDVLVRLILGLRISMTFGLLLVLSSVILGVFFGALQGYFAGWVDILGQRLTEIWSALPFLLVMILLGNTLGRSFVLLLICYAVFNWISIAAYIRAEYLRLRKRAFVDAARTQKLSSLRIMLRHILPNAITPLITLLPFELVGAIGALTALDYLGFGLPAGTPSWGDLLAQAQLARYAWWLILYPALALFVVMLLGVFIGEALRDAFDPREYSKLE